MHCASKDWCLLLRGPALVSTEGETSCSACQSYTLYYADCLSGPTSAATVCLRSWACKAES